MEQVRIIIIELPIHLLIDNNIEVVDLIQEKTSKQVLKVFFHIFSSHINPL